MSALPGLVISHEHEAGMMAALQGRTIDEMSRRMDAGHRAYVARFDCEPAAWGWVATRTADIGELGASFTLGHGERYLWNFVTRAPFRGRGIYPHLLDAIIAAESREAERFWIAWAPENRASGAGIAKAGFVAVADLSFDASGRPAVHDLLPGGARIATRVLGIAKSDAALAPCWRCVRAGRGSMAWTSGACQCDYQVPRSGCAA